MSCKPCCKPCCTVIGPRGLPGRAGLRGPTGPSAGPRGPTGPAGPTGTVEVVAGTVLCSGIVNYDPLLSRLEYGPIDNNLFAETDAFVFCKAGILSQAAPAALATVPTTAQLLFFEAGGLSTAALGTLTSTDCNSAYVQSTGTILGLKTKNRLFQQSNIDQPVAPLALVDFTDANGFRCFGAAMTTAWTVTASAIWTVTLTLSLVSTVAGSVTISIRRGAAVQNQTTVSLTANQQTAVSLSWTGILLTGETVSVQSQSLLNTITVRVRSINIVEL